MKMQCIIPSGLLLEDSKNIYFITAIANQCTSMVHLQTISL